MEENEKEFKAIFVLKENLVNEIIFLLFFNWYSGEVESNWVHSALRLPIGLLCQPRLIMLLEKFVE
jgi:hypothetical protein